MVNMSAGDINALTYLAYLDSEAEKKRKKEEAEKKNKKKAKLAKEKKTLEEMTRRGIRVSPKVREAIRKKEQQETLNDKIPSFGDDIDMTDFLEELEG